MTVRIRNASADSARATTKAAVKVSKTVKAPAVAPDQAEDEASHQAIPAVSSRDDKVPAHAGQGDEAGAAESPSASSEAASGGDAAESLAQANGDLLAQYVADAGSDLLAAEGDRSVYNWNAGVFGDGNGTSWLLWGALGLAAATTAVLVLDKSKDKTAPAAPSGLALAAADDTGASNSDRIINLTSGITITGNAEADSTVQLFNGATSLGTATAGSNGSFSIDVALPAGTASITAVATDKAGNASPASPALAITVDTTAPAAPTGLDLAAADDTGVSNSDNITDQTSGLTFSGSADAGSKVELFNGATSLGSVTAGSDGKFVIDLSLSQGNAAITAKALDTAGNASAATPVLNVSVGGAPTLLNSSIDGNGNVVTLYFSEALDASKVLGSGQFKVTAGTTDLAVGFALVSGNTVSINLNAPIATGTAVTVSYTDPSAANEAIALQDLAGNDAASFANAAVTNRVSQSASLATGFAPAATIKLAGAEISAFDPASDRLFVTSNGGLQVVKVNADLSLTLLGTISLGSNDVTSVSVKNGIVAASVSAADKTQPGTVYFIKADGEPAAASTVLGNVAVGALPDMLTFTPDGKKVLVANEGEQNAAGVNPVGSVSIIDISGGVAAATVRTAGFDGFNGQLASLKSAGVRLFAGNAGFEAITVAQDLEPEYISVSPDGSFALVTLQENSAVGVLDLVTGQFTDIVPLGLKTFNGLPVDTSDRDGLGNTTSISLQTDQRIFGQYMPDGVASFTGADGKQYFIIANEGDDRDDFITPDETARVGSLTLDATAFADSAVVKGNGELGRLTVSNAPGNNGDTDGDGDIDKILAYGARSFSILNEDGVIVFDSGSHIEQFVAARGLFTNASGTGLFDDTRSDNKGPEPEGVTIGVVGERTLAFVALERGGGGVMIYDVTDVKNVSFVQYLRQFGDEAPEGVVAISAADSPNGQALVVTANEVSNTLTVYANSGAGPVTAPASTITSTLTPIAARTAFTPIINAGQAVGNGYVFDGIPDGMGVYDNGNGTFTLLVNHEFGATAGVERAHGSVGAYVSELVISKATLAVISGRDFLASANDLYLATADGAGWTNGVTTAFNRFCSADLALESAFRTPTLGYQGRLFLTGEEAGNEGRGFALVATGADAGKVYELAALGNMSFENLVANPLAQTKTIVAELDDTSNNGQVYFYIGDKRAAGNAVEQAGLTGGKLFGLKIGTLAAGTEVGALTNPAETGLGLVGGQTTFSLIDLGDVSGKTGATINTDSIAAGVTNLLRPEDGAWSLDGKTFYFVTTASATTASRLWSLQFSDIANPEAGGTVKLLLDGSEGQVMFDNMTVSATGQILLQEDPGGNDRLARIWSYDLASDQLTAIAEHNPAMFTGTAKITNDEESSGIIDVTSIFAGQAGYNTDSNGYFLIADQIHSALATPASAVEMGQLSLMVTSLAFA